MSEDNGSWRVNNLPIHVKQMDKTNMYFLWMNYRTSRRQTKVKDMSQAYSFRGFHDSWYTLAAAEAQKGAFRAWVQTGFHRGAGGRAPSPQLSFEEAVASPQKQSQRLKEQPRAGSSAVAKWDECFFRTRA